MTGREKFDPSGTDHAQRFVVVLNRTQDVVNIATSIRAMLNMGLRRLRLVAPVDFNAHRISGIAHGSEAILDSVEFFDTLADALADVSYTVGSTARRRSSAFVWEHPREAAGRLVALARARAHLGPVALVFGQEDTGLATEELDLCDMLVMAPTDPSYASLNLSQAVLLVTYELWLAAQEQAPALPEPKRTAEPVTTTELNYFFEDTERALAAIDFFKTRQSATIMRTARAVFRRAELNAREAKLFRAIMIEVRKYVERLRGDEVR